MRTISIIISLALIITVKAFSYPSGIAQRTLKTTTDGCGSCHAFNTSTTGSFTGPDTVTAGQTVSFTLTYSGTNSGAYGVDIAAKTGVLAPGSSSTYLKLLSDELVHKNGLSVTTLTFSYTAPSTPGKDTLFATVVKGHSGRWNWIPNKGIVVKLATGITKEEGTVNGYSLNQNYPNPFNPVTRIGFSIPKSEFVSISVFDIEGREVAKLLNTALPAGNYSFEWKADKITSGVYYYRIKAGDFSQTKSMIVLK
jgi:hypothetical protein